MKLLLDTHVLLRATGKPERLPEAITGAHAVAVDLLPPLHGDPFDRILIAQAKVEGIVLLTADEIVARYPGPIRAVCEVVPHFWTIR